MLKLQLRLEEGLDLKHCLIGTDSLSWLQGPSGSGPASPSGFTEALSHMASFRVPKRTLLTQPSESLQCHLLCKELPEREGE